MLEKVIDFFILSMKISATAERKVKFTMLILSSACMCSIGKKYQRLKDGINLDKELTNSSGMTQPPVFVKSIQ